LRIAPNNPHRSKSEGESPLTKTPEDHLPKRAPKKTGKAGIKALEVDEKTKSAEPGEHKPELLSDANKKKGKKNPRLPGMEDAEIEELEEAAEEYADIRDQRQELTVEEVRLKKELLDLMHANKKTEYNHNGVSIKVVVESEKVKVRIKKDED
jgi:hypothetical protein